MANRGEIPTLNLEGADVSDFKIVDESKMGYIYGGRYCSDEYIQVDGKNGPENMHRVTVELLCDHDQFMALMKASSEKDRIAVQLV